MLVVKEEVLGLIVGDVNVGIAVAVEVSSRGAHGAALEGADAGFVGHVREGAVAVVVIETVGVGFVIERAGIVVGWIEIAVLGIELHIAADEQIDATVFVVVEPGGANRPAIDVDSGFRGDIREGAVPVVVIENRLAVAGYEEIDVAVVVVVGGDGSHAVNVCRDSGLIGDVGKFAVAVIAIEMIVWRSLGLLL